MTSTEQRAKLERVAKEIVEPLRERARQSLAYLDDLIAQARTGTEISLYESTRDKTLAQFDKLEQEIAAALAACAREAEKPLLELIREMVEEMKPGPGAGGNDYHDAWQVFGERLERAAGEKA